MRYGGIAGALALALLSLTGCGTQAVIGSAEAVPIEGTPRAVLVTPGKVAPLKVDEARKLIPGEPFDAPPLKKMVEELRLQTLVMVQFRGEVAGSCKDDKIVFKAGGITDCMVTYNGLQVPWQITVSDDFKESDMLVKYTMKPLKGVLQAEAVHALFAEQYQRLGDELRCDQLPAAQLVEPGKKTEFKCQYRTVSGNGRQITLRDVTVDVSRRGSIAFL
ncbi:hypothetical protein [Crossiella cryophila]|uniref:DUF4333 domain-containing protein n=1 Tax=Crossiella cryophila TaxID=43355 RepID=A0A7W7FV53_9PSEU|nr:hypothetical protein [Crossiella cryophila]MBB4678922.1 hypothetical protein [Crossiella cryophila]